MTSNRRSPAIITSLLGVALALGGAVLGGVVLAPTAPAWAEDPVDFGSTPIVDTVGALGDRTDEVLAAIEQTYDATGHQLFVAYVSEFTNPESAVTWANDTAVANNMGDEDYLLAVAVDGRAYYLSAADGAEISDADLDRISSEVIEPELADDDWAGAAIAAAQALDTSSSGSGWGWVWFLVIAAAVVAVIAIVLSRRSKKNRATDAAGGGPGAAPLVPLDDLRRTAGSALVQADDAVKTSEEELGFATASYGDEATAAFRAALAAAKAKVAEAFGLQQRLDDDTPDTDADRRAAYEGIIRLTGEADAALDEQAEAFDALRDLERNAPAELERVTAETTAAEAAIGPAAERLRALGQAYAASALAAVADNPAQASSRIAFATEALARARQAVAASQSADAAVAIRAAEESSDQAVLLARAVDRLADELAQADRAIDAGIADLEADVVTARELGGGAAQTAERTAAAAAELRAASTAALRDPLAAGARLAAANHEIDAVIAGAREAAEQAARAQALLERSIAGARVQVQTAEDYLVARRGAVGTEARTRLASAAQLLQQAQTGTDPELALEAAQRAERLASEALSLARNDVEGFGGGFGGSGAAPGYGAGRGSSGGGDLMGAVLGGILIDSMLGGGRRSSGGSGGFGGFGGGSSGGGFGGSSRSGGGRSAGSFGGSATRGRRGSGGRF